MRTDQTTKCLLWLIAILLAATALRPYMMPPPVAAQSSEALPFYVEPGTSMVRAPDGSRQVLGKVMIDMRNGNVWGLPTLSQLPYPVASDKTTPPVSHPFLLGQFALADTQRSVASADDAR